MVGRAELLSAICFFLAFLCYVKASEESADMANISFWLLLSTFITGCALLFKEQGLTVVVNPNLYLFVYSFFVCLFFPM